MTFAPPRLGFVASLCGLLLSLSVGCASSPETEALEVEGPSLNGELVVVVFSERVQGPVPARGTVTLLSTMESVPFDTVGVANEGKLLSLSPGRYAVAVSHRLVETGSPQPVAGEQVLYVEPGARARITVVVKDRKGDLGRVTSRPPRTADSPLPPEPSSG